MNNKNKKGISPLIATVLVIGFTIVLAALVIQWGTQLFKTTTTETGKTSQFSLLCTTGYNVEYSFVKNGVASIDITAKNQNEKTISGFLFVAKTDKGTTKTYVSDPDPSLKITPTGPITEPVPVSLGSFAQAKFILPVGVAPAGEIWNSVDVRPVATLDSGEKKICENEETIKV